jgi:hypothetical protein
MKPLNLFAERKFVEKKKKEKEFEIYKKGFSPNKSKSEKNGLWSLC